MINDVNFAAARRGHAHRAVAGLEFFRARRHQTVSGTADENCGDDGSDNH